MAVVGQSRPISPGVRTANMRTPLFIFGIALALVAFLVMFAFGIVFVGRSAPGGSVPVVVARQTIPARTTVTPDMLTLTSLPAAAVGPNTYVHIADVKGAALVDINKGQAVSSNLVTTDPNQVVTVNPFLPIPAGMTAIEIPTNEQQGVGGYIQPGDYIDIVATVNTAAFFQAKPHPVSVTVYSSVYVMKVGPAPSIQGQTHTQGVTSSLTVVMNKCDINYINWLLANGAVKYSLLSSADYPKSIPNTSGECTASSASNPIGPSAVDAKWHFTNG